jgi:hypothetical protein
MSEDVGGHCDAATVGLREAVFSAAADDDECSRVGDAALLLRMCVEAGGFASPALNDTLLLHGRGLRCVQPSALAAYSGLRALHLERNALRGSAAPLLRALGGGARGLRALFLTDNSLTSLDGVEACAALASLHAAGNHIAAGSAAAAARLAASLRALPDLATLVLAKNPLAERPEGEAGDEEDGAGGGGGDAAVRTARAAAAVAACASLTSLDLGDCGLAGAGGALLAALARLPRLAALNLRGNAAAADTRAWRKTALLALPRLAYLDDATPWRGAGLDTSAAAR